MVRRSAGPPRRGFDPDDRLGFAKQFVHDRMVGFRKDIKICLSSIRHPLHPDRRTRAWFPALMSCCGTLEYLTGLWQGNLGARRAEDIAKYTARFMPQYNGELVRVLWKLFRNKVAHHGIASGIWLDQKTGHRYCWELSKPGKPGLEVRHEPGVIWQDTPGRVRFTHRVYVRLLQFSREIDRSANDYVESLEADGQRLDNFYACMSELYPNMELPTLEPPPEALP